MELPPTTAVANVVEVERKDLRESSESVAEADFNSVPIDSENAATLELLRPMRKRARRDFAIVVDSKRCLI